MAPFKAVPTQMIADYGATSSGHARVLLKLFTVEKRDMPFLLTKETP